MRTPPSTAAGLACDRNTKKFLFRAICFPSLYLQVASPWHCSVLDVFEHIAEHQDGANRPRCGQWQTASHCQGVQRGGNPHPHHLRPPPRWRHPGQNAEQVEPPLWKSLLLPVDHLKNHHIWIPDLGELLGCLKWGQVNLEEIYPFKIFNLSPSLHSQHLSWVYNSKWCRHWVPDLHQYPQDVVPPLYWGCTFGNKKCSKSKK